MEIDARIDLIARVYHVQIGLTSPVNGTPLTPAERDAFSKNGEPIVACGGTFSYGEGGEVVLPANDRRLPSEFPVRVAFSVDDSEEAYDRAVAFRDTITTRMTAARDSKISVSNTNLGHSITTV